MEMTTDNLWHEIDRLGMENLKLKQAIKKLEDKARAAGWDRDQHLRGHRHRPEAHKIRVAAHN
jgi:hypothetical protein